MSTNRKYWKGLDELNETQSFLQTRDQEFPRSMSVDEFLGDENLFGAVLNGSLVIFLISNAIFYQNLS